MVSADDIYLFVPLRPMTRVSDLFTQQLNIEVTGDSTALNVGIDYENFHFTGPSLIVCSHKVTLP